MGDNARRVLKREQFERVVDQAMQDLPREFRQHIRNLSVRVQDQPTMEQLERWGLEEDVELLGFYEGIPLTGRGIHYGLVTPDVIYIFQEPIEAMCANEREIASQVNKTVWHEVAHYFGIDEERLNGTNVD